MHDIFKRTWVVLHCPLLIPLILRSQKCKVQADWRSSILANYIGQPSQRNPRPAGNYVRWSGITASKFHTVAVCQVWVELLELQSSDYLDWSIVRQRSNTVHAGVLVAVKEPKFLENIVKTDGHVTVAIVTVCYFTL